MWLNHARKGQTLYLEGNRAAHLYALRRGTVKLIKLDVGGREHVSAILTAGSLFGFEAAFDEAYTTGAEAHADSELCLVSAEDLRKLMREIPQFGFDLARCLYRRLVTTQQRQAYLANPGARARLAGYLVSRLPDEYGEPPLLVPHELTLRELGGILGLAPETVCRTIGSFQAEGVIEVLSDQVLVRDPGVLVQVAAH
jgi:CRP/FNR family transcriptional regulator